MKDCNQCGRCCLLYGDGGLSATDDEIAWWRTFRPEIAEHVRDGRIWVSPETGEPLSRCPWLEHDAASATYGCRIYHDRPNDCRHYPVTVEQMENDGCEMLEVRDLTDRGRAQRDLDRRMMDSRPPLG